MTRSEFLNDVTEWYELLNVMSDSEWDYHNDTYIYDDEQYDEMVKSDLQEEIRDGDSEWYEIRRYLNDCPDSRSYHYYLKDYSFEYHDVTDEFDDYKDRVFEWLDENDWFDDDDDDEDAPEEESDGFYVAMDTEDDLEEEDMELSDDVAGDGFNFHAIELEVA